MNRLIYLFLFLAFSTQASDMRPACLAVQALNPLDPTIRIDRADFVRAEDASTQRGQRAGTDFPDSVAAIDAQSQGHHEAVAILNTGFRFRSTAQIIGRGAENLVLEIESRPDLVVIYPATELEALRSATKYQQAKQLSDRLQTVSGGRYVMRVEGVEGLKDGHTPYLLAQRASNGSLADMMSAKSGFMISGSKNPRVLLSGVRNAAEGLGAIHSLGKVHGDIKPENILVDDELKLIIGDLTTVTDREGPRRWSYSLTADYADRARLAGNPAPTVASDIHGLSLVIAELLLGKRLSNLKKEGWVKAEDLGNGNTFLSLKKPPHQIDSSIPKPLSDLVAQIDQAKTISEVLNLIDAAETALTTPPETVP